MSYKAALMKGLCEEEETTKSYTLVDGHLPTHSEDLENGGVLIFQQGSSSSTAETRTCSIRTERPWAVKEGESSSYKPWLVKACGYSDIYSCTVPNCQLHEKYCNKCQRLTPCAKVFRLEPIYQTLTDAWKEVPESAQYVDDYVCLACHPKPICYDHSNHTGSLTHHSTCYVNAFCMCHHYYCSVKGCTRFMRRRDQKRTCGGNGVETRCHGHEMFCTACNRETFWVIEHAWPEQIKEVNKEYVSTTRLCGPCYGYKSDYRACVYK